MNVFQDLFTTVLNMSVTASYVALGVILIHLLLKKAPKLFSYLLWLPVLFRLVCPFSFAAAFSFLRLVSPNIQQGIQQSNGAKQWSSGICAAKYRADANACHTVRP